ncbi:GFA family protein [Shimia sp. NS0008-38b]|uniref:GFA family protein n=1 Tax=Shimia sp. NS0008-38b TaxID=3127653 RepID=UPI003341501E
MRNFCFAVDKIAQNYQCRAIPDKFEPITVGHCHCEDCRKSSGAGHCTRMAVPEAAIMIRGEMGLQSFEGEIPPEAMAEMMAAQ